MFPKSPCFSSVVLRPTMLKLNTFRIIKIHVNYIWLICPKRNSKKARYERFSSKLKNTYTFKSLQNTRMNLQCAMYKISGRSVYLAFSPNIVHDNWRTGKIPVTVTNYLEAINSLHSLRNLSVNLSHSTDWSIASYLTRLFTTLYLKPSFCPIAKPLKFEMLSGKFPLKHEKFKQWE